MSRYSFRCDRRRSRRDGQLHEKLRRESRARHRWHYNTGETNLIGTVVERATRKELAAYASEEDLGALRQEQDAAWMLDRSGHVHAGCCVQASTRDFARIGQFILDGGRVDGTPILAEGWLDAATRKQADIGAPGRGYANQWWTVDNGTSARWASMASRSSRPGRRTDSRDQQRLAGWPTSPRRISWPLASP
jgi:CubicO group peptidase (beta-lactamase class C family)